MSELGGVPRPFDTANRIPAAEVWRALGCPVKKRKLDRLLAPCWNVASHKHGDKDPSLNLGIGGGPLGNGARCFSCGWSGSSVDLVVAVQGGAPLDAAKWILERFANWTPVASAAQPEAKRDPPVPQDGSAIIEQLSFAPYRDVRAFLQSRGLLRQDGDGGKLQGWGVGAFDHISRHYVAFGYLTGKRDREILYWKLRDLAGPGKKKHMWVDPRCPIEHQPLYLGHDLDASVSYVVIVEGELDALTLRLVGIPNVVGLPQGADSARHVDLGPLEGRDTVYVATDQDEHGYRAARILADRLTEKTLRRVTFRRWDSDGAGGGEGKVYKDANEALLDGMDTAGFEEAIRDSVLMASAGDAGWAPAGEDDQDGEQDGFELEGPPGGSGRPAAGDGAIGGATPPVFDDAPLPDDPPLPDNVVPLRALPGGRTSTSPGAGPSSTGVFFAAELGTDAIPADLEVPSGYKVTRGGEVAIPLGATDSLGNPIDKTVMHHVIVPTALYEDIETHERYVDLVYQSGPLRHWATLLTKKVNTASARELVKLTAQGLPSEEPVAKNACIFLQRSLVQNTKRMELKPLARRFGWFEFQGGLAFVLGDRVYTAGGKTIDLRTDIEQEWKGSVEALCPTGQAGEQRAAILATLLGGGPAALLILASFASVLYPWTNPQTSSFFVHLWSRSTRGKTSALAMAASLWGNPKKFVIDWTATPFGQQVLAGTLSSLPFCIDELQVNNDRDQQAKLEAIYQITNGRPRLGATAEGKMRSMRPWSLIGLSTGERPMSDVSPNLGLRARCIESQEAPFGESKSPAEISAMRVACATSYGHLGQAWIQWLVPYVAANQDGLAARCLAKTRTLIASVEATREQRNEGLLRDGKEPIEVKHDLAHRWAHHLACIAITAEVLVESGILQDDVELPDVVTPMLDASCEDDSRPGESDQRWLESWVMSNVSQFDLCDGDFSIVPAGREVLGYRIDENIVGVIPEALTQALRKRAGHMSTRAFIARMAERGIHLNEGGRHRANTRNGRVFVHPFGWEGLRLSLKTPPLKPPLPHAGRYDPHD